MYPTIVNSIFNSNTDIKYLPILIINVLLYVKIEYVNLGLILDSEASISSNYCVQENIFLG